MLGTPARKHRINLSDYNFERDIENRIFLSDLSVFEVEVLEEILEQSIRIPIEELTTALDCTLTTLTPCLEKFSKIRLLNVQGDQVVVNKEMRRLFEGQIQRFDPHFRPGIAYIFELLGKVPIHLLPTWYAIPRTSDDIFESIVERYLVTPKVYRQYLAELELENPVAEGIVNDVFAHSELKIHSDQLREKYQLTQHEFQEIMLLLELHFVLTCKVVRIGNQWVEVVTPLAEWKEHIEYEKANRPEALDPEVTVERSHTADFGFLSDAKHLLSLLRTGSGEECPTDTTLLPSDFAETVKVNLGSDVNIETYLSDLLGRLSQLGLLELDGEELVKTDLAEEWLETAEDQDRAVSWYRQIIQTPDARFPHPSLFSDKNVRQVEKSLRCITGRSWTFFDQFLKHCMVPVGNAGEVKLEKHGRRFGYTRPEYSEEERAFIEFVILQQFFECGLVIRGTINGKTCFQLTPFGRIALGE